MDSASKRSVIRSPLEMLACDRTPPPPAHHHHHQHGHDLTVRQSASTTTAVMTTTSTPQHQKIHVGAPPTTPLAASNQINGVVSVTRTTTNAQERIHFAAARQPVAASSSPTQQLLVSGAAGADIPPQAVPAALVPREGEEPSALMFMSPPNQRRLENGGGKKQHRRRSSSSSSTRHQDNMEDENMFSRAQAEAFVRRTLEDYEQRRDEEEERVLSDIKHEMKLLNEKREHAERHAADMQDKLRHEQEMVAKLEAQCMMLASTTQEMHDELLAEQNRAKELDIAGCHADDRRRTQVAEARRELEFERGQWAVVKDEFEKRLNDLHEAHRREMEEVRFRAHEAGSTVTELEAQLKASNAKLLSEVQQRENLAAKLRDAESALERTAKEAKESGQSLERKSTVLERREQSRADELRSAQQHSKQLEESIKGLNDDVRKKMHRIQTLEGEVQKSRDDALAAWRERDTIVERGMLIHASVEALWGTLKSGVRQQVSSALDQLRNHHNGGGNGAVMASSSIRTNELLNVNNKAAPSPAASGGDDLDSSSYFPEEELLRQLRAELGPEGDEVDYAVDAEGEAMISGTVVAASQHTYRGRAFSAFHQTPRATGGKPTFTASRSSSVPHRRIAMASAATGSRAQGQPPPPPDTLRVLNLVHEKAHALLRQLHLRHVDTVASIKELRDTTAQQKKDLAQLKEERNSLAQDKESLAKNAASLAQKLRGLEESASARSVDVVALGEELRCARTQTQHWEQRWRSLEFESTEMRAKVITAEQRTEALARQLETKDEQQKQAEISANEVRAQLDSLRKEMAQKSASLEAADEMLRKSSREVGDVLQQKEKCQKQITKLHSELAHNRSELSRTHEEVAILQARSAKLEGQLGLARKSANRLVGKQEHQSEALQQELSATKAQLKLVSENATATERDLQDTAKKLQQYRSRLTVLFQGRDQESLQCRSILRDALRQLYDHKESLCSQLLPMSMPTTTSPPSSSQVVVKSTNASKIDPFTLMDGTPTRRRSGSNSSPHIPAADAHAQGLSLAGAEVDNASLLLFVEEQRPLADACSAIESVTREVGRAWNLYRAQKQQQLQSLEQTVAFLELELQCQTSQIRQQQQSSQNNGSGNRRGGQRGTSPKQQQQQLYSPGNAGSVPYHQTPPSPQTPSAFADAAALAPHDGNAMYVDTSSSNSAPLLPLSFVSPPPMRSLVRPVKHLPQHQHDQHVPLHDTFTEVARRQSRREEEFDHGEDDLLSQQKRGAVGLVSSHHNSFIHMPASASLEPPSSLSVLDDVAHVMLPSTSAPSFSTQGPSGSSLPLQRRSTSRSPSPQAQTYAGELQTQRNGTTTTHGDVLQVVGALSAISANTNVPSHGRASTTTVMKDSKSSAYAPSSSNASSFVRSSSRSVDGMSESPMRPPSLRAVR